jgi:hypothetical protein
MLPEFDRMKRIHGCKVFVFVFVFETECIYDVVLGLDFLRDVGLKMGFEKNLVTGMDGRIGMKQRGHWNQVPNFFLAIIDVYDFTEDEDFDFDDDAGESYMMDAKYEAATPHEVAESQTYVTGTEKRKLEDASAKHPELFNRELRLYPHEQVHLDIDLGVPPVHSRPYAAPRIQK